MKLKTTIGLVVIWLVVNLLNYYALSFYFALFVRLLAVAGFLVVAFIAVRRVIQERYQLSRSKIFTAGVAVVLFLLTPFPKPVNRLIESIDWHLGYTKRASIVDLVKQGKLTPNVSWSKTSCELPYEFPIVSNSGNTIEIRKCTTNGNVTVAFYVVNNYFSSPSTYFVYTEDRNELDFINSLINYHPEDNWRISENWYRIRYE